MRVFTRLQTINLIRVTSNPLLAATVPIISGWIIDRTRAHSCLVHLYGLLPGEVHFDDRYIRVVGTGDPVRSMPGLRQLTVFACFLMRKPDKDPLSHLETEFVWLRVVVTLLVIGLSLLNSQGCTAISSTQG